MNQIKHLLFACLVLISIVLGFVLVRTISSAKPPVSGSIPYDYLDSDTIPSQLVNGQQLFKHACASCHALRKEIVAPALHGVTKRGPWKDRKNLYKWVRDPAAFMAKDPYTQRLKKQYGLLMTAFPQLSDEDIDAIINYVESDPAVYSKMPVATSVNGELTTKTPGHEEARRIINSLRVAFPGG
jgi:mono/diheme cytochrome c family protein